MLDSGDTVGVESPSYLGGLLVFKNYDADYVTLPTSAAGLDIAGAAAALDAAPVKPKFIYLVPTYQNPSGYTMTEEQRRQLYQMACERDLLLVEDDPYGELSFEGPPVKPLKAFDREGRVAYFGSFSKIGVPGFRLGWVCADPALVGRMTLAAETSTVSANVFSQAIAAEYFKGGYLPAQLQRLREVYKGRRDAMLKALKEKLPAQITFNSPQGGFFVWLQGPPQLDTTALFEAAIEEGVAYVPGSAFYAGEGEGRNTLRLTFVAADEATIIDGVGRLAAVLNKALKASPV
jgi:2-aminoadipate transaminase